MIFKNDDTGAPVYDPAVPNAVALEKAAPEQRWIRTLDGRMPFGKVIVAIANKHARQIWTMLAHNVDYEPHACLNHPMQRHTQPA